MTLSCNVLKNGFIGWNVIAFDKYISRVRERVHQSRSIEAVVKMINLERAFENANDYSYNTIINPDCATMI